MKVLYIDATNGVAGDMLLASLIQLSDDDKTINELNNLGITNIEYRLEKLIIDDKDVFNIHIIDKGNEFDCHLLRNIGKIIDKNLNVDLKTKEDIFKIYDLIGRAESIIHNKSIKDVHFHELGRIETFCNIVGIAYLINKLEIEKVTSSLVHVGKGKITCSHGTLDIPAPATKILLKDIPYYSKDVEGELCTPTGAAIIKYYVKEFNDTPTSNIIKTAYGMGKKKYSVSNLLKAIIYEI